MNSAAETEKDLLQAWMRGIAMNPQTSSESLIRLLTPAGRPAWETLCGQRTLPDDVVEAIITHPEPLPRITLASSAHATQQQRGRLARDPDATVRLHLARGPRRGTWLIRPLPDEVLEALLCADEDAYPPGSATVHEIALELHGSFQIPGRFTRAYPTHRLPVFRLIAASRWETLSVEQQAALAADPDPQVRAAAHEHRWHLDPEQVGERLPAQISHGRTHMLLHYPLPRAVAEALFHDDRERYTIASNPFTAPDLVARLARHEYPEIRSKIASRPDLDPALQAELLQDADADVRMVAEAYSAATTPEQRMAVKFTTTSWALTDGRPRKIDEFLELGDPAWYERCAASDNLFLRRAAALDARLSDEAVRILAADPDDHVRSLLMQNHPAAPPELLIQAFIDHPQIRPLLLTLPHMPRTGLAGLLGHRSPQVRALAAADITLPTPPTALLDDPVDEVRHAAAANPLLPKDLVERLLDDPACAQGAAANPRLDPVTLNRLLEAIETNETSEANNAA